MSCFIRVCIQIEFVKSGNIISKKLLNKNLKLLTKLFYLGKISKNCVSFALCSLSAASITIGSTASISISKKLLNKNLKLLTKLFYLGKISKDCVSFAQCSLSTISMTFDSSSSHGVAWELSSSQFHGRRDGLDGGCLLGYNDFNNLAVLTRSWGCLIKF